MSQFANTLSQNRNIGAQREHWCSDSIYFSKGGIYFEIIIVDLISPLNQDKLYPLVGTLGQRLI